MSRVTAPYTEPEVNAAIAATIAELQQKLDAANERIAKLDCQIRECLFWFNKDGSPCDGPRFRDEFEKLRRLVDYDGIKVHDYSYRKRK